MEYKCKIKTCGNTSRHADLFISPPNKQLLRKWQAVVGTKEEEFFVCERHFNKKFVRVDKNLSEIAVPTLNLNCNDIQLENSCCGFCLDDSSQMRPIEKENKEIFLEITGYEPLTHLMCLKCKTFLLTYKSFKEDVQSKHELVRNAANGEIQEDKITEPDECMIIDDSDDEQANLPQKVEKNTEVKDPDDPLKLLNEIKTEHVEENFDQVKTPESLCETISSTEDDTNSLDDPNKVRCLDCNKVMGIVELLQHRLKEHPEDDDNDKKYPEIPSPPYQLPKLPSKLTKKVQQEPLIVACEYCFIEMNEKSLEKHINVCHLGGSKDFLCHICSKSFTKEHMLRNHLIEHEPENMHSCDICGKCFVLKHEIRTHILGAHLSTFTKLKYWRYQCEVCDIKFRKKSHLVKHMSSHDKGYGCGVKVNTETNYFDCYKCGGSYPNLRIYEFHSCERGRYQIKCTEYQVPIGSTEKLRAHKLICKNLKSFGSLNK